MLMPIGDQFACDIGESGSLTLSIVSKIIVAAPRPAANASRQGDACPRFIAAIKTPKNTWGGG